MFDKQTNRHRGKWMLCRDLRAPNDPSQAASGPAGPPGAPFGRTARLAQVCLRNKTTGLNGNK